jgi:hypothetical protein
MFETFMAALWLTIMIFCTLMLVRNSWVHRTRMSWLGTVRDPDLEQNLARYKRAVGYNAMLLRWWCWKTRPEDWTK